ncbi:MAG: hypothetical protein J6Y30_05795 [Treponema sp.]|nr:hypothetical protein [Treponema sp.]
MKVKFFLASLVFLFAGLTTFVSCSLGKDEGTVKIAIPSRSALARSRNSAARAVDGEYISIFIVGDYEDKKTVPFIDDETAQTVTFDSIPAGAAVRVVCTWNYPTYDPEEDDNRHLGCIGVSDEIVIVGGEEQTARVVMKDIALTNDVAIDGSPSRIAKLFYVSDDSDSPYSCISLPGSCSYEFTFTRFETISFKTSSAICEPSSITQASIFNVTARIFFDGTEVLKLYVPDDMG